MTRNKIKPMLFSIIKHTSPEDLKKQLPKDIISGVIVAIVALPLSIALAIASGVGPEMGLYTAIVAGFIISFLGGSRVQISGPTAAFATIVAGIVATDGLDGLFAATMIAGVLLILMGLLKLGTIIRFVPYTVTTGFTAGIAITIVIGQVKDLLGLTFPEGTPTVDTAQKLQAIAENIGTFNWQALLVGAICLAILLLWPKVNDKIPSSLVAVVAGAAMVGLFNMDVNTIGDLYIINSGLPTLHVPQLSLDLFRDELANGITIAILAAIESLLSCVVADSMISSHHRCNMELVAQGVGNIGSVCFGGIPATGAIARTAANIKSGGRTPVAGMVHALVLAVIMVFLMPYAALIPMPTIAAILLQVAYNMSGWRNFAHLCTTASKGAVAVLLLTCGLTVVFDLVTAIAVGMLITVVLFMKMVSEETEVKGWVYYCDQDSEVTHLRELPKSVRVYEINGPMFFGMTDRITDISVKSFTKYLIIRMRGVPSLDSSGMNALENLYDYCNRNGVKLIFSHANEQPMRTMRRAGFVDLVGEANFRPNIDDAIAYAKSLLEQEQTDTKTHITK
ncbi:MAG: SulP family inorganic anion transporter [Eggerthellales bacterium]|nr:SulP family inorganic anion transporter [Eggerthellales bacterium]